MKIAIDLTQIPVNKTGIGIYAENLIREFHRIYSEFGDIVFIFFLQDDDPGLAETVQSGNPNATIVIPVAARRHRRLINRFFFEQFILPGRCRALGADAIFSLHYTTSYFTRIPRYVMVPDMTFYLFPELHRRLKVWYFRTMLPLTLRWSRTIITISESTRQDLLNRFPRLNPQKVRVTHLGVHPHRRGEGDDPHADADILGAYGLENKKYFLFIGTLEPRKNIAAIIRAFHLVRNTDSRIRKEFRLAVVGKKGWFYHEIIETAEALGLGEKVIFTGYVKEEDKQALLRHAFLFIYPSIYEGFGIPLLEAMAAGLPVITGNVSSLPEVAGEAALCVDPHNWREIAAAMLRLSNDMELYNRLTRKGIERAKQFSWDSTARKTLELFMANGAPPPKTKS